MYAPKVAILNMLPILEIIKAVNHDKYKVLNLPLCLRLYVSILGTFIYIIYEITVMFMTLEVSSPLDIQLVAA